MALKWQPKEDNQAVRAHTQHMIYTFLRANQFSAVPSDTGQPQDHVLGRRGECDVIVKAVAPQGWNESQMKVMATGRKLLFVSDGQIYLDAQPVWRTWFADSVQRTLSRIGFKTAKIYVFGISPALPCGDLKIDWGQITELGLEG
jgi:hypothetical protein